MTREFDLNIEQVLENWTVATALREVIANALEEQALTGTAEPQIFGDAEDRWHIRDRGRGLRYEHLTQNENKEKLAYPDQVVGKFGVGLKDALATFDRHRVAVAIRSRHGDITTGKQAKHGFDDIKTLHALITEPIEPDLTGTEFILSGHALTERQVEEAKGLFLRYSGDEELGVTPFGSVLRRTHTRAKARIYVNGLRVAEEDNFLFSYNITSPTAALRRVLNGERSRAGARWQTRWLYARSAMRCSTSASWASPSNGGSGYPACMSPETKSARRGCACRQTAPDPCPRQPTIDVVQISRHHRQVFEGAIDIEIQVRYS